MLFKYERSWLEVVIFIFIGEMYYFYILFSSFVVVVNKLIVKGDLIAVEELAYYFYIWSLDYGFRLLDIT